MKPKKDYIELTEKKKDAFKVSQELTYQFSPKFKRMKDKVLKPSPHQPPALHPSGQLYEPVKYFKLIKMDKEHEMLDEKQILAGNVQ